MFRNLLLFAAALVSAAALAAQDSRGTIVGRVTDPAGATMAGADIRATNVATGVAVAAK